MCDTVAVGRDTDGELIELIDADPTAFGVSHAATPTRVPRERAPLPWKRLLIGLAAAAVVAGAAVGVLAWAPWEPDLRLVLSDPRQHPTALSAHLVLDHSTADQQHVEAGAEAQVKWNDGSLGYFFAEPGATFQTGDGTDKWFAFQAEPVGDAPNIFGQRTIAGAPAEVSDESGGTEIRIAWGPVDGWVFSALAVQMTVDDAVAIAEQLRIADGAALLRDRTPLRSMRPIGPFGAYKALLAIQSSDRSGGPAFEHTAAVFYGDGGQSVVSTPAPESVMDMVPFAFTETPTAGTVHGQQALGLLHGSGPFGELNRSTVLWWEGGRLVAVTGGSDLASTFELAETVRPAASTGEWPQT